MSQFKFIKNKGKVIPKVIGYDLPLHSALRMFYNQCHMLTESNTILIPSKSRICVQYCFQRKSIMALFNRDNDCCVWDRSPEFDKASYVITEWREYLNWSNTFDYYLFIPIDISYHQYDYFTLNAAYIAKLANYLCSSGSTLLLADHATDVIANKGTALIKGIIPLKLSYTGRSSSNMKITKIYNNTR